MEIKEGDNVTWLYMQRGGYGYVMPVNAKVVKISPKRIQIEIKKLDGSSVFRWVKRENLVIKE